MESPALLNLKMVLTYEGTRYLGWQKTKMGNSIEEALEKALEQITHLPVKLEAASRTDAGVHAEGQVVCFKLPYSPLDIYKLQKGLNALLPHDIRISHLEVVPLDFHPTLDVIGKEYHYSICNDPVQLPFHRHFSWHIPYSLDIEIMRKASSFLLGTHDFSAFSNKRIDNGIRTLKKIEILSLPNNRVVFIIQGDNFLYKMVRNLVGTLVYVGAQKLALENVPVILASRDRKLAGVTAPAHGLALAQVFYDCCQESDALYYGVR